MSNDIHNNSDANNDLSFHGSHSQELDLTNPDIMRSIQNSQSIEIDISKTQPKQTPVNNPYLNPTTPAVNDPIAQSMQNAETTNEFDLLALNPSARAKLKSKNGGTPSSSTSSPQKPQPELKNNPYISPAKQAPVNDPVANVMSQAETTNEFDLLALNHTARSKLKNESTGYHTTQPPRSAQSPAQPKEKTEIHINKTLVILIAVFTVIFGSALAIPYFSYKSNISASIETQKEIEEVEKQLQTAVEKGSSSEDIDKLYASLVAKQKALDSLSAKVNKGNSSPVYNDTVALFVHEIMTELHAENYHIPKTLLDRVSFYINKFTAKRTRGGMELIMKRRDKYFPYIEKVFTEKKVPLVLAYVSMQESLLDPNAKSHAGAAGLWQFIPSTGRTYGLKINSSVDERLQWRKATVAAAGYFRKLLSLYGKGEGVLLAIASYNAGEHKIMRALAQVEDPLLDRDFFYLYRTSTILAKETREYVPQILARAIIDRHRDYYGF